MKLKHVIIVVGLFGITLKGVSQENLFDLKKDLLLAQFDCKTDVDDLHTVAALRTLLSHPKFKDINYHAVAGTYGIQKGLYVPANELFQLAYGKNWSDAHSSKKKAIQEVLRKVNTTLFRGGDIWVADAGQSDFSASWIKELVKMQPQLNVKDRIHIVQHSDWNEEVTDPKLLVFVKEKIDYHKIPDGNAIGNGTPGFRSDEKVKWKKYLKKQKELRAVWELAIAISDKYNGKEGRYLNKSIAAGGLDFSDLSETCYILNLSDLKDADAFFKTITE